MSQKQKGKMEQQKEKLDYLRQRIDEIDQYIMRLLELRFETVSQVAEYKLKNNMAIFDPDREKSILNRIMEKASSAEHADYIKETYISLMNISKNLQKDLIEKKTEDKHFSIEDIVDGKIVPLDSLNKGKFKVVYQGVPGSYSEEALNVYFSGAEGFFTGGTSGSYSLEIENVAEFSEVCSKVENGEADYGILPIENSSTGSVTETIDLLAKGGFFINGEVDLPVRHYLLGVKGAKLSDIQKVYSHQQGFLQCGEFLSKYPDWLRIVYLNTASSAKMVAESGDKTLAAISSKRAAEIYGLDVLAAEINGLKRNSTRFVIFSKSFVDSGDSNKVSIMFALPHSSGTLYHSLKNLADRGLNMLKIESRPSKIKNWEYFFFVDFEGNLREQRVLRALTDLKKETGYFRVLGNYRAGWAGSEK